MNITFKNEGGIRVVSDTEKLKEFYQQQTSTIGNVKGSPADGRKLRWKSESIQQNEEHQKWKYLRKYKVFFLFVKTSLKDRWQFNENNNNIF